MNKRTVKKAAINWKWLFAMIFIVGAVPSVLYANTLTYGLVFNDIDSLHKVLRAGEVTPVQMLVRPFTQPYVSQSFVLDFTHYQQQFGWYHLVNIWVHLSAATALSLLVFAIARPIALDKGAAAADRDGTIAKAPYVMAALAGLIFGCHPLCAQMASYLSARGAGLEASNFLFALLMFVVVMETAGAIRIWSLFVLAAYGFMCFVSGVTATLLAPSMVAVFFLLKPEKMNAKDWIMRHQVATTALAILSLTIPIFVMTGARSATVPNYFALPKLDAIAYYMTQGKAFLTYYLRAFIAPLGLSIDPPFAVASGIDVLGIVGIIALVACGYALVHFRKHSMIFLGLWLMFAGYLPHALMVQTDAVTDEAFYLSTAGLSLAVASLLARWWHGPLKTQAPKMVALVVVLGALAVFHNLDFRTNRALIASTLLTNPKSEVANILSAKDNFEREKFAEAVKDADQAISFDPTSATAYFIRGQAQLRLHQDSEAKHSFEKADEFATKQHMPILGEIKYGLAESYLAMDKIDKANEVANAGFVLDPESPRAKYVMGLLALKQKKYPMAMSYLQQAKQAGVIESVLPAAEVLLGMKQYDQAARLAQVIADNTHDPKAYLIWGNAALALGDLPTAEKELKEALKADSHNAQTLALLSILYQLKGDKAAAESYHKDAEQLDRDVFVKLLIPDPKVAPEAKPQASM